MAVDRATKFIVLSTQRSGSTWLIDILNNLENTTAYGELFLRQKRTWDAGSLDYPRFSEAKLKGPAVRPLSTFAYLDGLYRMPGPVGFKLMYSQVRVYPEILVYLCRHHVRVVHLVRRNHLDVVISGAITAKTDQAHLLSGQPEPNDIRIEINPETLINRLKKLQRNIMIARKPLRWCRLPHIEVTYEDLLRDQSCFSLIWNFLSIN